MANMPRFRKRVFGLLRAPDGSAFQKCDLCGVSVAVALYDMHDCKLKQKHKRFKGRCINQKSYVKEVFEVKVERSPQRSKSEVLNQSIDKASFSKQPRSPFCFFMESFKENLQNDDRFVVDQLGFDTWRTMSTKERQKYVVQAEVVNLAYEKALLEEVNYGKVDDEADSMKVGKFDVVYNYEDSYDSESAGSLFSTINGKWCLGANVD